MLPFGKFFRRTSKKGPKENDKYMEICKERAESVVSVANFL
jgi:hypothetical protein